MPKSDYKGALHDFVSAVSNTVLWGRMGWSEVRGKYRRTSLGPFWATISLGAFIFAIGQVWSRLWGVELDHFMPYVAAGFVSWTMISSIVSEGTNGFIKNGGLIKSINFPLPLISCSITWQHITLFFHNFIIIILAGIFYQGTMNINILLLLPGLLLIWLNAIWVTTLFGLFGARFRDIQVIVSTILSMMIFMTPIFWTYDQIEGRVGILLIKLNPFLHYIEILRQPVLGNVPDAYTYTLVIAITLVGWFITIMFYSRYKHRVAFWV